MLFATWDDINAPNNSVTVAMAPSHIPIEGRTKIRIIPPIPNPIEKVNSARALESPSLTCNSPDLQAARSAEPPTSCEYGTLATSLNNVSDNHCVISKLYAIAIMATTRVTFLETISQSA